jgi:hypothetical protein
MLSKWERQQTNALLSKAMQCLDSQLLITSGNMVVRQDICNSQHFSRDSLVDIICRDL